MTSYDAAWQSVSYDEKKDVTFTVISMIKLINNKHTDVMVTVISMITLINNHNDADNYNDVCHTVDRRAVGTMMMTTMMMTTISVTFVAGEPRRR